MIKLQIKKYLVFLPIFTLVFILSSTTVSGKEDINLNKETINPGSVYYPFKRMWEKFLLFVPFPINKVNYQIGLIETRLSELNNVVKTEELSELQQSSQRFSYQAGILVDQIMTSSNSDKQVVKNKFKSYIEVLNRLRDKYHANSSFWLLIQQDIDTLNILINKL